MNADAVAWLHLQHGDDVSFLGISSYPDRAEVAATAERVRLDGFPQIHDPEGELLAHFSVTSHPTVVLVGRDGSEERVVGAIRDPIALGELIGRLAGDAS